MRYAVFVTGVLAAALSAASSAHAQLPYASQMSKLSASDGAVNDFFGQSVALSGSRALVGARIGDGAGADNAGSAYVFERQPDASWLQVAELWASDGSPSDNFGSSVSLSGERALVGAKDDDTATGLNVGSAYVFERQPGGAWLEVAKLTANDGDSLDTFGNAVSLSGDRALVGAFLDSSGAGAAAGSAYVFERQPSGTWLQVAKLTASDAAEGHSLGRSVSLEGDRALVGAIRSDAPADVTTGAAYVFERQTDGTWLQAAKFTASDAAFGDWFGSSVALQGQRALVGASLDDTTAIDAGSAYLFELQGPSWVQVAKLTASDASEEDRFGSSVELSGDRALVGAATELALGPGPGAAYLYERQGDGSWPEVAILTAADGAPGDNFGASDMSFEGDRILLGAFGDDALTGSAYVFRICDGCAVAVGTGTPGCNGAHSLQPNLPPESGLASFALRCTNAPPSAFGFLGLGNAADAAGSDPLGFGVLLHIDLFASSFVSILGMPSSAAGLGSKTIPIPPDLSLVGVTIVAQALWPWASCSLPPLGLSSSPGLAFTILAP